MSAGDIIPCHKCGKHFCNCNHAMKPPTHSATGETCYYYTCQKCYQIPCTCNKYTWVCDPLGSNRVCVHCGLKMNGDCKCFANNSSTWVYHADTLRRTIRVKKEELNSLEIQTFINANPSVIIEIIE